MIHHSLQKRSKSLTNQVKSFSKSSESLDGLSKSASISSNPCKHCPPNIALKNSETPKRKTRQQGQSFHDTEKETNLQPLRAKSHSDEMKRHFANHFMSELNRYSGSHLFPKSIKHNKFVDLDKEGSKKRNKCQTLSHGRKHLYDTMATLVPKNSLNDELYIVTKRGSKDEKRRRSDETFTEKRHREKNESMSIPRFKKFASHSNPTLIGILKNVKVESEEMDRKRTECRAKTQVRRTRCFNKTSNVREVHIDASTGSARKHKNSGKSMSTKRCPERSQQMNVHSSSLQHVGDFNCNFSNMEHQNKENRTSKMFWDPFEIRPNLSVMETSSSSSNVSSRQIFSCIQKRPEIHQLNESEDPKKSVHGNQNAKYVSTMNFSRHDPFHDRSKKIQEEEESAKSKEINLKKRNLILEKCQDRLAEYDKCKMNCNRLGHSSNLKIRPKNMKTNESSAFLKNKNFTDHTNALRKNPLLNTEDSNLNSSAIERSRTKSNNKCRKDNGDDTANFKRVKSVKKHVSSIDTCLQSSTNALPTVPSTASMISASSKAQTIWSTASVQPWDELKKKTKEKCLHRIDSNQTQLRESSASMGSLLPSSSTSLSISSATHETEESVPNLQIQTLTIPPRRDHEKFIAFEERPQRIRNVLRIPLNSVQKSTKLGKVACKSLNIISTKSCDKQRNEQDRYLLRIPAKRCIASMTTKERYAEHKVFPLRMKGMLRRVQSETDSHVNGVTIPVKIKPQLKSIRHRMRQSKEGKRYVQVLTIPAKSLDKQLAIQVEPERHVNALTIPITAKTDKARYKNANGHCRYSEVLAIPLKQKEQTFTIKIIPGESEEHQDDNNEEKTYLQVLAIPPKPKILMLEESEPVETDVSSTHIRSMPRMREHHKAKHEDDYAVAYLAKIKPRDFRSETLTKRLKKASKLVRPKLESDKMMAKDQDYYRGKSKLTRREHKSTNKNNSTASVDLSSQLQWNWSSINLKTKDLKPQTVLKPISSDSCSVNKKVVDIGHDKSNPKPKHLPLNSLLQKSNYVKPLNKTPPHKNNQTEQDHLREAYLLPSESPKIEKYKLRSKTKHIKGKKATALQSKKRVSSEINLKNHSNECNTNLNANPSDESDWMTDSETEEFPELEFQIRPDLDLSSKPLLEESEKVEPVDSLGEHEHMPKNEDGKMGFYQVNLQDISNTCETFSKLQGDKELSRCKHYLQFMNLPNTFTDIQHNKLSATVSSQLNLENKPNSKVKDSSTKGDSADKTKNRCSLETIREDQNMSATKFFKSIKTLYDLKMFSREHNLTYPPNSMNLPVPRLNVCSSESELTSGRHIPISGETNECSNLKAKELPQESDDREQSLDVKMNMNRNAKVRTMTRRQKSRRKTSSQRVHSKKTSSKIRPSAKSDTSKTSTSESRQNLPPTSHTHAEPSTPAKIILVAKRELDEKCPHRTKALAVDKSDSYVSSQTSSTSDKATKSKPPPKKQLALTSKTLVIRATEDPSTSSSSRQTSTKTANPPKPSPKAPTSHLPYRSQPLGLPRSGSSASSPTPSAPSSSKLSLTKSTLESKETARSAIIGDSKEKPRKPPRRHPPSGAQRIPVSPLSSTSDRLIAKSPKPKKGARVTKRAEAPKSPVQTQSTTKSLSSSSALPSPSEKSSMINQQLKDAGAFTKPADAAEVEIAAPCRKEAARLPFRTQTIGLSRSGSSRSSSPSGSNQMMSKSFIPSKPTKGSPKTRTQPPLDALAVSLTQPKEMEQPPNKTYVSKLVIPPLVDKSKTNVHKAKINKLQGNTLRQHLEPKKILDQPTKVETSARKADSNVLQPKTRRPDKNAGQTVPTSVEASGGMPKAVNLPIPPDKKLRINGMKSAIGIQNGQVSNQAQKATTGKWDLVRSKLTNIDKKPIKQPGEKNGNGITTAFKNYSSKLNVTPKSRIAASTKDVLNAERDAKPTQKPAETTRTQKLREPQNVADLARVQPADAMPQLISIILESDTNKGIPEIPNNSNPRVKQIVQQVMAEQRHQKEAAAVAKPTEDGTEDRSALGKMYQTPIKLDEGDVAHGTVPGRIKHPIPRKLIDDERYEKADVPLEPPPRIKTKRHKVEKAAHHKAAKKQAEPMKTHEKVPKLKSAAIKVIAAQKFLKTLPKSCELVVVKPKGDANLAESILEAIPGYLIKEDSEHPKAPEERKSHKMVPGKPIKQVQKGRSPCKKVERSRADYATAVPSEVKRHAAPRQLEKDGKCQKRALIECCLTDKQFEQLSKQRKDKLLEASKGSKIPKQKVCEGHGNEIELDSQLDDYRPKVHRSHTITRKTAKIYNVASESASKLELRKIEHKVTTRRPKRRCSLEDQEKASQRRCKASKSARAIKILQNNLQLLQHRLTNNKQLGLSVEQLLRILCRNLDSEPTSRDMEDGRELILEVDWDDVNRSERRTGNRGCLETEYNNSSTNCNAMNFNYQTSLAKQASKIPMPLSRFQAMSSSQANDKLIENSTADFPKMSNEPRCSQSLEDRESKSECLERDLSDKDAKDTESASSYLSFSLLCEECRKQTQAIMEQKASRDQPGSAANEAKETTPFAEDQRQSDDPKQDANTRKCFFKKKRCTSGRNCSSRISEFHEIPSKDMKCNLKEQQKAKTPRNQLSTKLQIRICQSRTYMPPIVPVDRKVRRSNM